MGQIYIEDYVVSFLKQKKTEATDTPIKLALYGTIAKPKTLYHIDNNITGDKTSHYIYGAAAIEEDRTIEEIGDEYFPAYQFIGYVNVRNCGEAISKYHIFYDENTAMQDYLLFYHMSPFSTFRYLDTPPAPEINDSKLDKSLTIVKAKKVRNKKRPLFLDKLKLFILSFLCLIIATSISTIDDYAKMSDFVAVTKLVIEFDK